MIEIDNKKKVITAGCRLFVFAQVAQLFAKTFPRPLPTEPGRSRSLFFLSACAWQHIEGNIRLSDLCYLADKLWGLLPEVVQPSITSQL